MPGMFRTFFSLQRRRERCEALFRRYYPNYRDQDRDYEQVIRGVLDPARRLLDAGAGERLEFTRRLAPDTRLAVGLDRFRFTVPGREGRVRAVLGDLSRLPFADRQFGAIISRSVFEHLEDPRRVAREFFRVLEPGGSVVILTPNRWDYVSIAGKLTPYAFHRWMYGKVLGAPEDDAFPTFYRANTRAALHRQFGEVGFEEISVRLLAHHPVYLGFSPLLYRLGVGYDRLTRRFEALAFLRGWILAHFRRPTSPREGD